ncbi:hypothetical protein [Mesorhizobium sp. M0895]|uniref:hypothetical protein n=1 Tax=Mesorhizobium sp. M0895 TaxID=2957019 RepID=UPI00333D38F4
MYERLDELPTRQSDCQTPCHELILQARRGQIISVKETIAAVRRDGPHLAETDCELVEFIVNVAPAFGLFVGFDLRE